jgi:hypothetical protein
MPSVVGTISVSKLIDSALGSTKTLSKIADAFKALDSLIPTEQMDVLKALTKSSDDLESLTEISALLSKNSDITKKITGSLEGLTALEVKKIYQLAEKLDDVNVDEIAPLLKQMPDDLSILATFSKIEVDGYLTILQKTGREIDPSVMKKLTNLADLDSLNQAQVNNILDIARKSDVDVAEFKKLVDRIPGGLWDKNYINKMLTNSDDTLGGGLGHWFSRHVDVTDAKLKVRAVEASEGFVASRWTDEVTARNIMIIDLQSATGIQKINELLSNPSLVKVEVSIKKGESLGSAFKNISGIPVDVSSQLSGSIIVVKLDLNGVPYITTSFPNIL